MTAIVFDVPENPVWVALTAQPDKIMARMVATLLSANGIHARVTEVHNQICVEVQEHEFDHALKIYDPSDSGISAPMQEDGHSTSIHTGKRIREQLAARRATDRLERTKSNQAKLLQWIVILVMLAGVAAFVVWALG
ncbi:hypothetical protein OAU50_08005 [Planctomycetota bacterium]|nr:hypothetical protein [Planctomycetota bacterium]